LIPFAAAACGDMRPTSPGRNTSGPIIVAVPNPGAALVGSWSFSRFFYDDAGNLHGSQTVWTFFSGGSVTRTLYSDNFTAGIGDVIVTAGTWSATPAAVDVVFQGSTTPTRYEYHFEGTTLVLAGLPSFG
jgi:hypothetical protein